MTNNSAIIARLRDQAKSERVTGDGHYENADALDRVADLLAAKAGVDVVSVEATFHPVGGVAQRTGGRGKPPGAMSKRWRGHFAEIFRSYGPTFSIANVQKVIAQREGREMRDSEVRRLFEGNVKHGYLVVPGAGFYQATTKLMDLIGLSSFNSGSPLPNVASQAPLFGPPTQETTHGA